MNINQIISKELKIREAQVETVAALIDEGSTIPFIARYRKEQHGGLDDEILRQLDERLTYLRNLESKKATVLSTIEEQGALTEELRDEIDKVMTLVALEDLYRPYKPKRRTRAIIAKEKGLEPLAMYMRLQQEKGLLDYAQDFINEEKGVSSCEEAIAGAMDIIAEQVSDDAQLRSTIRQKTWNEGVMTCEAKDDTQQTVYEMYYHFEEKVTKLAGHRILAINRAEDEKVITAKIVVDKERMIGYLEKQVITNDESDCVSYLKASIEDAYERLIAPAVERDIRSTLKENAEDGAIKVFGKNLAQLLMQPPILGQVVLGWDPAFRTGCKLAVVDATGKVLDTTVIFPTAPQNKVAEAKKVVSALIDKYKITLISLGNGTASRESEQIIADMLGEINKPVHYVIVNEAGASVYSASKLATIEFPNFDVGQRSAASIARRIQDPLAELVKIDPKSIGVGQYQHDMNQKKLGEALENVVEDCVNKVGVDLNTASASLLEYVSGISKAVAKNIVAYREANGAFLNRKQLMKVDKLGAKAFEQCAGFLRIYHGEEPLDMTAVHPENYKAAKAILKKAAFSPEDIKRGGAVGISKKVYADKQTLEELALGEMTFADIMKELEKPSRDPREEMPKPLLRSDVLEMEDLKEGMILKGTIRNVIDFGAFVDIGVHQDGLVHISQITNRFIKHPLEAVSVGDIVDVKVMSVDLAKKRIQLTMKGL